MVCQLLSSVQCLLPMLHFVVMQQDRSVLQGLAHSVVEAPDSHHCSQAQLAKAIFQVTSLIIGMLPISKRYQLHYVADTFQSI